MSDSKNVPLIVCTIFFAVPLVFSYIYAFKGAEGGYVGSSWWLGMGAPTVRALIVFQVLAAVGFLGMFISWSITPPQGGVLGKYWWSLPLCMSVFLVFSALWACGVYMRNRPLIVVSLIVAAVCGVLFVAGAFEETTPKPHVIVFTILLANCVVLCDGVGWNSRFIASNP